MPEEPRQYWVRNDKGKMWGPLTFATIELLVANGLIPGRLQASRDGIGFAFPGRFPDLRDAFPKELWGDSTEPLPDDELSNAQPSGPPVVGAPGSAPREPPVVSAPRAAPPAAAAAPPETPAGSGAAPQRPSSDDGMPATGELGKHQPFFLYYLAGAGNETGKLSLKGPEVTYELFFKKGSPEAITSSRPEEDLGAYLVKKGIIKPEQLADARKIAPGFGGSILNALFGLQLLNPGDAFKVIGDHALELIIQALQLGAGSFGFERDAAMPPSAMPLGDRWAIACKAVRAMPIELVRERLGERLEMPVMKSGGRVELEKLKLNAQEARATSSFDGVHSLEELCELVPGEGETMVRTAFLLWNFEMLSFAEGVRRPRQKPAAEAAKPAPSAPESPAATAAPAAEPATQPAPGTPSAEPAPSQPLPPRAASPGPAGGPPRVGPAAGAPPRVGAPAGAPPRVGPPAGAPPRVGPPAGAPPRVGPPAGGPPKITPTAQPSPAGSPPRVGAPAGAPPRVGAPAQAPAAKPVAAAKAPAAAGDDLAALRSMFEGLKSKNHFQLLDLPDTATPAQIKTAFFKLAKSYHPDTVPADAPPEIAKLKADIFAAVNEAYRVLLDDKLRASYVEDLKAGSPEAVDAARILAAEESFQKGCILVKARKYQEAVEMLTEAVYLNDKEGEFHAWRGWAVFLAAKDKAAAKNPALKDLETAIKLNPKCAHSYYFVGQITKLSGDAANALKWFKKTLSVDPNHVDAQREVRLAATQKTK